MKAIKLISVLTLGLLSVTTFAAGVKSLVGEFTLIDGENCPKEAIIKYKDKSIFVYGETYYQGERLARIFENVNGGKNNYPDDFGTSNQSLVTFKDNALTSSGRQCSGLIIKNCGKWIKSYSVLALDQDASEILVKTEVRPFSYDYSGFPAGSSCTYSRN